MSALEQEIIERLKHLSETAKLHVLEVIKREEFEVFDDEDGVMEGELSDEEWWKQMQILRQKIAEESVHIQFPSAAEMVRELRDEES